MRRRWFVGLRCALAWSVDGDGFEVLNHDVELHGVLRCGFRSNIVHGFLKVVCMSDDLTFLVRDGEVNVLHHVSWWMRCFGRWVRFEPLRRGCASGFQW